MDILDSDGNAYTSGFMATGSLNHFDLAMAIELQKVCSLMFHFWVTDTVMSCSLISCSKLNMTFISCWYTMTLMVTAVGWVFTVWKVSQ